MAIFQDQVYKYVRNIPEGKVVTYGDVALALNKPGWARQVGWVLHQNKDSDTPCHRVVDRNGCLAPNFAFDGADEQRRRLEIEGVNFKDQTHVDMRKSLWKIK